MPRRTRRSVSTLGGAAPDTIIGRAAADRAGARPYRAHVAKTRRNVPRRIARERVPTNRKATLIKLLFAAPERSCDVLNNRSWLFLVRKPCRRIFVGLWKIGRTENYVPERKHEGEILAPMAFFD